LAILSLRNNKLKIVLTLVFILVVIYHNQVTNNFTFLLGDKSGYDNTIHSSILEHWFNFFQGKSSWSQVGYFYPYERTIAQTDGYFLTGLIYSPFRILGLDPYLATEFVGVTLKIIGFFGVLLISQKVLNFNLNYSLIIATLFSLNNAMTAHGYRIQLATVAFVPWLFYLHFETIKAFFNSQKSRFFSFGSLSMIFFGLWCITCFYMSWFYAFYALVLLFVLFFLSRNSLLSILHQAKIMLLPLIGVIAIGLISLFPFIYAYYPKSLESGTRIYEDISFATLTPENLFQLGDSNRFYSPIYSKILQFLSPNYVQDTWEYYNMGISLFIFILALGALFYLRKSTELTNKLILALLISAFFSLILILRLNDKSLWELVFYSIPGAKALGVVNTFMLILSLPLYIGAIFFISKINLSKLLLVPLILFLFLSEYNSPLLQLDRQTQARMNLVVEDPLPTCESFYVTGWQDQEKFYGLWEWVNNQYGHNTSAMMIAQIVNLPTLNGMASFIPKDYDLVGPNGTAFSPNSDEYKQRISSYTERFELQGVCELDLNTKKWSQFN
jgi:hypothetical protein